MATTTTTSSNHDGGGDLSSPWCIVVKTVGRGFENRRSLDSNSNGANDHQATTSKVLSVGSDGALSFSVTVSPNDRVDSLHDEIEDVTGVKASQQRLIYRGRLIGTADVGTSHAWFRSNNSNYNSNSNSNSNINSNSNSNSNNNGGASPLGIEHQHETETNDQDSKTCRDDSERENQPQEYKIRDIVGLCDGQTIHLVKKREDDTKLNSGSTEEAAASREGNAGEDDANNNNNNNSNSNSNSNSSNSNNEDVGGVDSNTKGILATLGIAVSSGFASVYTEKVIKSQRVKSPVAGQYSLAYTQVQLASMSLLTIGIYACIVDFKDIITYGLFYNFNAGAFLTVFNSALGGLIVAGVLKYADSVLKGYATAISVIGTGLMSMVLFGTKLHAVYFLGIVNVVIAVLLYNGKNFDQFCCS